MGRAVSAIKWCSLFYRTCQSIGDAIVPGRCVACHMPLQNSTSGFRRFVCSHCEPLIHQCEAVRCKRCALALGPRLQAFGWTHCRHCKPVVEHGAQAPLECVVCSDYLAPFDQWIALLKYGNNHGMARFLGHWLGTRVLDLGMDLPDVLVPVPVSPHKLRQRGYNQAALIARHLGRHIRRPVKADWLIKTQELGAQATLGREDRLQNLHGAFRATRRIPGNIRIGLVDDVITTGATIQSCAAALRKAGAESIVTMAVCRTPE